jgi:hypothetical protein
MNLKNELHGHREKCKAGEFIEIESRKWKSRAPQSWWGGFVLKRGCLRNDLMWGFYPFPPGCCSISMIIKCAESSIIVDCACNILIDQSWSYSLCSAFPSCHSLRSQGGHNGGFRRPFLLSFKVFNLLSICLRSFLLLKSTWQFLTIFIPFFTEF